MVLRNLEALHISDYCGYKATLYLQYVTPVFNIDS